jgi:two-component system chemotaxis response regulator CheB
MSDATNAPRDLVVIGASAGGVDTLMRVVAGLPADLAATICIVVHIAPSSPSALARILERAGPLHSRQATDGEELIHGEILVAAPDRHLVIEDRHVRLNAGPRENGHRPAVDTLFRTAAAAQGGRVVGVVLSGNRDDGTAGLAAIKAGGGATIVQDPDEALYRGMPANALAHVQVDAVVRSDRVAEAIAEMVSANYPPPNPGPGDGGNPSGTRDKLPSQEGEAISVCPDCGGILKEEQQAGVPQWACRVGHRYSAESLVDAQATGVESALWSAIRSLEERGELLERLAAKCDAQGQRRSARSFRNKAHDAGRHAELVRSALSGAAGNALRLVGEAGDSGEASVG